MQTFRAATTIDGERRLRLLDVPFHPGTIVDVIVLEHGESPVSGPSGILDRLSEEQYRLAEQYSGEYVILVGTQIVHHTADRQEAIRAYQRMGIKDGSPVPVIVSPDDRLSRRRPVTRGRALVRKVPKKA